MTDQEQLAYSAIDRWEREGEYPDENEFMAIMNEWRNVIEIGRRFERVIQACEEAEHLRRVSTNGVRDDEETATDTE